MIWLAAGIVTLFALLGVALTAITGPGTWLAVLVAAICAWWQPELFNVWTLVACAALALLGELFEFFGSAVGSRRAGGSRPGAWGSLLGSFLGLFVGQVLIPIPILGALVGAVAGAGVGAVIFERGIAKRTWRDSARSGTGAAAGRALATVLKTGVAVVIAAVLIPAAWWNP
jgi:uncharacterized protein YqgC (DUF456 family)